MICNTNSTNNSLRKMSSGKQLKVVATVTHSDFFILLNVLASHARYGQLVGRMT